MGYPPYFTFDSTIMGNSSSQDDEKQGTSRKEALHNMPNFPGQIMRPSTGTTGTTVTSRGDGNLETHHQQTLRQDHVQPLPSQLHQGDIDMDVEHVENAPASQRPAMLRRKSTILLDDHDDDSEARKQQAEEPKPISRVNSGQEVELAKAREETEFVVETLFEWKQGGNQVFVTGSFTEWRKMVKLKKQETGVFLAIVRLPPGTYRLRFVVDNELLCSNELPTATDSMGNLVNYIEVEPFYQELFIPSQVFMNQRMMELENEAELAQQQQQQPVDEEMGDILDDTKYEHFYGEDIPEPAPLQYNSEIPDVFTQPEAMDKLMSTDFVSPPQLPPHLESVILNSNSSDHDNSSVLPIPNHVVLNHLATTSIKHNVLAVASISRYSRKYVTQILYAPLG